jgi:hypothetical protein
MSRPERVERLLRSIEHETQTAFDEYTELYKENNDLKVENAKLRVLSRGMYGMLETLDKIMGTADALTTPRPLIFGKEKSFAEVARELGVVADK